jgi:hypothetical protein
MKLPLIDILLSDAAARAICWTLVHSLWQGILAAAPGRDHHRLHTQAACSVAV